MLEVRQGSCALRHTSTVRIAQSSCTNVFRKVLEARSKLSFSEETENESSHSVITQTVCPVSMRPKNLENSGNSRRGLADAVTRIQPWARSCLYRFQTPVSLDHSSPRTLDNVSTRTTQTTVQIQLQICHILAMSPRSQFLHSRLPWRLEHLLILTMFFSTQRTLRRQREVRRLHIFRWHTSFIVCPRRPT